MPRLEEPTGLPPPALVSREFLYLSRHLTKRLRGAGGNCDPELLLSASRNRRGKDRWATMWLTLAYIAFALIMAICILFIARAFDEGTSNISEEVAVGAPNPRRTSTA